jgi:hypothetical protein
VDAVETPKQGTEKETLLAFLNSNRAVMVWKLDGVSDEDARRPMVESGTNLIGLIKHLAWVERWWFEEVFAGLPPADYPWTDEDPDADFRAEPGETVASVIAMYEQHVALVNDIIDRSDLDDLSAVDRKGVKYSLRWIVGHMIEETARHAGHADIIRELIDGRTGYLPNPVPR